MSRLSMRTLLATVVAAAMLMMLSILAPEARSEPPRAAAVGTQEPEAAAAPQEPAQEHAAAQEEDHAAPAQQEGHAAEDEHAEEEHAEEPKAWYYWPAKWTNFILLLAFLWWMLVNPPAAIQDIFSFSGLKVILRDRSAAIISARDLAAEQKEEAARLLTASEERLAKIEGEVAALADTARADAGAEASRALEEGKQQAQKILQVAEREVGSERLTAQRQLRGFVADLAVKLAERSLEDHLTADDQDRLIREYLSRLGDSMA